MVLGHSTLTAHEPREVVLTPGVALSCSLHSCRRRLEKKHDGSGCTRWMGCSYPSSKVAWTGDERLHRRVRGPSAPEACATSGPQPKAGKRGRTPPRSDG